jgi:predicted MFS family arabinose efflux permease
LFYLAQPLTIVIGAPFAAFLIDAGDNFGFAGWRFMFLGVSLPAIVVGLVAWFYLVDKPSDANWLTNDEKNWLTGAIASETKENKLASVAGAAKALTNGRVWLFSLVYFGLIYGLYALAFFLPTIISGFETQFGSKFNIFQKGLITAVPYFPAAIALFFVTRNATINGISRWHVALPAFIGAISIPCALYMSSPMTTVAVITVTACAIFSALPNFWSLPARFLSGAGAATGIALINTIGNLGGFAAPFITGALKDSTGGYQMPMMAVGLLLAASGVLILQITKKAD